MNVTSADPEGRQKRMMAPSAKEQLQLAPCCSTLMTHANRLTTDSPLPKQTAPRLLCCWHNPENSPDGTHLWSPLAQHCLSCLVPTHKASHSSHHQVAQIQCHTNTPTMYPLKQLAFAPPVYPRAGGLQIKGQRLSPRALLSENRRFYLQPQVFWVAVGNYKSKKSLHFWFSFVILFHSNTQLQQSWHKQTGILLKACSCLFHPV